jgi:hypothetical protein
MTETGQATSQIPANLLWTSGWDSTFRLLQLLLIEKYPVKSLYVMDPKRRSLAMEIRTIEKIKQAVVRERPECRSLLLPTRFVLESDIPVDANISAQISKIREIYGIGDQYDWLARFAKQFTEPVELSVERFLPPNDKWKKLLGEDLEKESGGWGSASRVVAMPSRPEIGVLRLFRFPVIELTKREMLEIAKKHKFDHLLAMTWFCHKPTPEGTPCGTCAPCCHTREDGFGWRIGLKGNLRDKRNTLLRKINPFSSS